MAKKEVEETKANLLEMNEIVLQLDPSIRAAAFDILATVYFQTHRKASSSDQQGSIAKTEQPTKKISPTGSDDLGTFISTFQHDKPAENVMLLAAWLYSNYGKYPISVKEIKELGNSCGLITPGRPDNTMRQAKRNGKGIFNQQGKGWQPTVGGELFFKETYNVTKGNKPLPTE